MTANGIYSKRCWIDGRLQEATIFFEGGSISGIKKGASEPKGTICNASDCVVMPGVIDAHVHVNEPGRADWEGFDTATKAAAAGGVTTIVDMPLNASPVTVSADALQLKLASTENKLHVNCGFYGGLVPGNYDKLQALIDGGVLGIKAFLTHSGVDEFPNVTEKELNQAMPLLAKNKLPLLVHCELVKVQPGENLSNHSTGYISYLESRPKDWEDIAVSLMIDLCRKHGGAVHIVHVSSANALQLIDDAKSKGLPVTAETCPHYVFFSAEDIPDGKTIYKCAPPIRERANNGLLKLALKRGTLDFIATDHSPAPPSVKEIDTGNLQKAWGGIAGLQFLVSASWTALKEVILLEGLIPLLTEHPAKFLNIDRAKGFLKVGYDADLTVWSPEENFIVTEKEVFHRHKISPYVGQRLWGKIHQTYVGGELVYSNGHIKQKNKGKWLLRK
jgi:allantoinase